jgi:hypothetical protein
MGTQLLGTCVGDYFAVEEFKGDEGMAAREALLAV